jgi:helicase MOV-10
MMPKPLLASASRKRKMNVALTRAKEVLFVISNPDVLCQDEHWKQWLAFCWRNGLVSDSSKEWDGDKVVFGEQKIRVLERALIAKEDSGSEKARVLGAGVTSLDMNTDYETWTERLREALDEESDEEDYEDEEHEEELIGKHESVERREDNNITSV